MKTRTLACALLLGACSALNAQPWDLLGNTVNMPTQYLGCNASSTQQLRLKTVANLPIDFHTANDFRARINQKVTYNTLGSFSLIPADGFTLITPSDHFLGSNPKGPFSRSHLAEGEGDNAQPTGYRPWQRNGITFTGNGDQGYIGQKYNHGNESDFTDMVIQWSDNPGNWKGDRMRFIFSSAYNGASTGMNSEEGLEGMRLYPHEEDFINVGVGDFFADGSDPSERLHVLNGKALI